METEFAIDPIAFRAAARRNLLLRASFVVGLVAALGMAASAWVPPERMNLAWSFALTVMAVYAAVEVSALQWARRSMPAMRVRLGTNELECWIGASRYPLAYRELSIVRVIERKGAVRRIDLKLASGARLRLAGFENMNRLAQVLIACVAEARADSQSLT